MQQPRFWHNRPDRPGWRAQVLAPFGALVGSISARRVAGPPRHHARCPVICVGNLNVGGTGKTPVVIALVERLGEGVHVVSRGYGGSELGPLRVDERQHGAGEVGDEPLLISAFAPTWVARDRAAGVRAAEEAGARVIVLDDGFQNPSVAKTVSIVVVDAALGFGNGRVMPAGPLREPVGAGLQRADLLLSIGDRDHQADFMRTWGAQISCPHATAHLQVLPTGMDWTGLTVLGFAGIGRPEKFFETLKSLGVDLVRVEALDDHQALSVPLMRRLLADAEANGAQLVTTEKDAVRLPSGFRQKVLTLPVRLVMDEAAALDLVLSRIEQSGLPGVEGDG